MTNKERLQLLLDGGIPDVPPHWELVFQIAPEMFGMDWEAAQRATDGSERAKQEATFRYHCEMSDRLIDECAWAAVPAVNSYAPAEVAKMKAYIGERALVPGFDYRGVYWMPTGEEIMDFVIRLFEAPEELHAEAREKCEFSKGHIRQLADAGADFFVGTYDFGFNDAPFVSPAQFQEFVTPYLAEIVAEAHALGKKYILHSDGCITQILDQIYSTGIDGYQSIDPQGHMDIQAVRAQYPDWLLMGNVACNMLQGTDEEEIRASVRYCMTYGGIGKPYIFSTSNCIFGGMPPESYRLMLDEYRRMCREAQASC